MMTDAPLPITGGCKCGAVRWSASAQPVRVRTCWCRDCQYVAAGSASVNAMFRTADISFTGALSRYESSADSGNRMVRSFCPVCGTPVVTASLARPDMVGVRGGTLDDPNLFPPSATIWTGSAPGWACIDPDLPRTEGQPPPI
jgi:hypothetical protein